ncbi:hypothetical protein Trydic_g16764 [Trypoxylus dichotomus]
MTLKQMYHGYSRTSQKKLSRTAPKVETCWEKLVINTSAYGVQMKTGKLSPKISFETQHVLEQAISYKADHILYSGELRFWLDEGQSSAPIKSGGLSSSHFEEARASNPAENSSTDFQIELCTMALLPFSKQFLVWL